MACKDCAPERNNPCPDYPNTNCIVYSGINLTCLGVKTNDRLSTILSKIDTAVCSISPEVSITMSNLGGGEGVYSGQIGDDYQFKSIIQGTGVNITSDSEEITIGLNTTYLNSNYWSLNGNSGTSVSTNFIGTTDQQSLAFKTNNNIAGFIENSEPIAPLNARGPNHRLFLGSHAGENAILNNLVSSNTFIGQYAGRFALSSANTFIGFHTGLWHRNGGVNGGRNVAVGDWAFGPGIHGYDNTAVGVFSLNQCYDCVSDTAIGRDVFKSMSHGNGMTGLGAYAGLYNSTGIGSITVTNGGSGYTTATVTISAPMFAPNGGQCSITATATATIDAGVITAITVTNPGCGYISYPTTINELGVNFTWTSATVTITGDGTGATATPNFISPESNTHIGGVSGAYVRYGKYNTYLGSNSEPTARWYDQYMLVLGTSAGVDGSIPASTLVEKSTAIGYGAKVAKSKAIVLGATGADQPDIGIGTTTPSDNLHLVGTFRYQDGTEQNGYILTSDTNGVASWQAAPSGYTDEEAQDAVGTILTDSSEIDFTYNDVTPSITASLIAGSIANSKLTNSAITIAGTSTSLGSSISQDTITGLASIGLVKRTGVNTLAIAIADTDYLTPGTASSTYQPLDADLTTLSTAFTTASASGSASLKFHEDTDNGTNAVTLQAPASVSDITVTLPSSAGTLALITDIPSLAGYVNTTGTPANNYIAVFTDADTVEGTNSLSYDGTDLSVSGGGIFSDDITITNPLTTTRKIGFNYLTTEYAKIELDLGSGDFNFSTNPSYDINFTGNNIVFNATSSQFISNLNIISSVASGNSPSLAFKYSTSLYNNQYINWDSAQYNNITLTSVGYKAFFGGDTSGLTFSNTNAVFNENGSDYDFRMEGNTDINLVFLDAGNNRVGIGTATPSTKFDVNGTGNFSGDVTVPDDAYDATSWNGNFEVPTKNAIRDKIESLPSGGEVNTASNVGAGSEVFKQKTGVDLEFRTFTSGTGISITENTNEIEVKVKAYNDFDTASIQTTDATPTTIYTFTPTGYSRGVFEVTMVSVNTTAAEGLSGKKLVHFSHDGTDCTILATSEVETDYIDAGVSTITWGISATGGTLIVEVTGEVGKTIDWSMVYTSKYLTFTP